MNYAAPNYGVAPVVANPGTSKLTIGIITGVAVCLCGILILGAIAIALGVGLGVGLHKSSKITALSAPTVSCSSSSATCGCPQIQPTFETRITSGSTATANSWPWMVALYINGSFRCGGSLINLQYVLTAAHCVVSSTTLLSTNTMQVYAGIQSLSQIASAVSESVMNVTLYATTSASDVELYDIAVLKLSQPFTGGSTVATCCLPPSGSVLPTIGQTAVIIGWGKTSFLATGISDTLQEGLIRITAGCSLSDTTTRFCAGYLTTDACQGDSGSPLMTSYNNSWTCTGIVSEGTGCGSSGIYTRVSYFRSWIDARMT
ncbi:unnamed protein product [Didymodactylos carnosus]|uniref:Peptidase S1 domain-containing protein n=1 Tax=Didymodactylos carnosus TaxID=1234261 RepID=A0A814EWE6_9BILA|nr:unnamed protein product [Didymodactylos carnosus]CAF1375765.1 unnamed protein product [Didymodactylos carnosus]CAF3747784.1 unnamed protein product [Didymodactylos carnosus]CAF4184595.1 unnamed protein product [Didymodactylos carnosus]